MIPVPGRLNQKETLVQSQPKLESKFQASLNGTIREILFQNKKKKGKKQTKQNKKPRSFQKRNVWLVIHLALLIACLPSKLEDWLLPKLSTE